MKRYLLNTPVLTSYGTYEFRPLEVERAKDLVKEGFESAIGHQGTASLLEKLLGVPIETNRKAITMEVGDEAIVTRLRLRLEEGKVLSEKEIRELYDNGMVELGLLKRIS